MFRAIGVALAIAAASAPAASAAVPPGASWSQATIVEGDGTHLHADVLRPASLPAGTKTPVILSIGPYFNHSGQTGAAGAEEGTSYSPVTNPGPSDRFDDFVEGARLMERGYTYVMVDLRGFGGSSGCLDWGGPGEQADAPTTSPSSSTATTGWCRRGTASASSCPPRTRSGGCTCRRSRR
jgi:predicted acyl esterase